MQGEHVSLWVYSRGEAARDLPYQLWKMVEDAGDWYRLLWSDPFEPTRIPRLGDLTYWVSFMHSSTDQKLFLLISDNDTGDLIGFIWFSQIQKESAYSSIWMCPGYRGKRHSREAAGLALKWAHYQMKWHTVFLVTPWPDVRNFGKKLGFEEVAFVPKLLGPDVWFMEHKESCDG